MEKIPFKDVAVGRRFVLSEDMKDYLGVIEGFYVEAMKLSGYEIHGKGIDYDYFNDELQFANELVELIDTCEHCEHWEYQHFKYQCQDNYNRNDPKTFTCANFKED